MAAVNFKVQLRGGEGLGISPPRLAHTHIDILLSLILYSYLFKALLKSSMRILGVMAPPSFIAASTVEVGSYEVQQCNLGFSIFHVTDCNFNWILLIVFIYFTSG